MNRLLPFSPAKKEGDMGNSKTCAEGQELKIKCIEVLISRRAIEENGYNLLWTLSVYSLENHPVTKNLSITSSDVFHFMVYDWERTVKQLLVNHRIPYSITQHFTPSTIYSDDLACPENQSQFFSPLDFIAGRGENILAKDSRSVPVEEQHDDADLVLDARIV